MYSLLIVDDEEIAVEGISRGIDWSDTGITVIYEAYGTTEAITILESKHVDILICDIEMPGRNGFELVEWANENCPLVKIIVLSGHDNFKYAQQALRFSCEDYLLKPVGHGTLKQLIIKTLESIDREKIEVDEIRKYKKYCELWESQKSVHIENFWMDIMEEKTFPDAGQLTEVFQTFDLPLDESSEILLVLIKVEYWLDAVSQKDTRIRKYAIRTIAEEAIIGAFGGNAMEDHSGNILVIVYLSKNQKDAVETLRARYGDFIKSCNWELKCSLSCYVGEPVPVCRLADSYKNLLYMENANVSISDSILYQKDFSQSTKMPVILSSFSDWGIFLETRKKDKLMEQVGKYLANISYEGASKELLDSFIVGVSNIIYCTLHKNGIQAGSVFGKENMLREGLNVNTIKAARNWAEKVITTSIEYLNTYANIQSITVNEITSYIDKHIYTDFSREDMANELHFNPDYLARIFKKETGMIISDYIIYCRIRMAKKLLVESNDKISEIASKLGYSQFSHFAKVFRNTVGLSPREFRRMYMKTDE